MARLSKWIAILQNRQFLFWIYVLTAIVASVHLILMGSKSFNGLDIYTYYNNFIIFRNSFLHLLHNQDLYQFYPTEQYDLYKYSPTFALAFFPFAYLPAWLGLICWNILNALLLFYAVSRFPHAHSKIIIFILWFLLQETLTSLQSAQTNPMIVALLIMAFSAFENKRTAWASLFIVSTVFIKLFGAVAFVLFLLYPDKLKFILYSFGWTILLALAPLAVVSFDQLQFLYESWFHLLQNDHSASYGLSVMGWLKSWFGLEPDKLLIVGIGSVLVMFPLLKWKSYDNPLFRIFFLSSILIWVIIFNHKAESSTFIIAVSGIALWYFTQERSKWMMALVIFAFVFTCLSPTDIFPGFVRKEFVEPYVMKAFPCILIWFVIQWQLWTGKGQPKTIQ